MKLSAALTSVTAMLAFAANIQAATLPNIFEPRNTVSRSSDGVGCTATVAASSTGFDATFYRYPAVNLLLFDDNNFVANDYTTRSVYATATGVTDPNFDIAVLNPLFADLPNYGLSRITLYSSIVELKGYFVGMYYNFFSPK